MLVFVSVFVRIRSYNFGRRQNGREKSRLIMATLWSWIAILLLNIVSMIPIRFFFLHSSFWAYRTSDWLKYYAIRKCAEELILFRLFYIFWSLWKIASSWAEFLFHLLHSHKVSSIALYYLILLFYFCGSISTKTHTIVSYLCFFCHLNWNRTKLNGNHLLLLLLLMLLTPRFDYTRENFNSLNKSASKICPMISSIVFFFQFSHYRVFKFSTKKMKKKEWQTMKSLDDEIWNL